MNTLLSEAEGKNIKSSKDLSSTESQLQDAQVRLFTPMIILVFISNA